jgi:hypothetical protein
MRRGIYENQKANHLHLSIYICHLSLKKRGEHNDKFKMIGPFDLFRHGAIYENKRAHLYS